MYILIYLILIDNSIYTGDGGVNKMNKLCSRAVLRMPMVGFNKVVKDIIIILLVVLIHK